MSGLIERGTAAIQAELQEGATGEVTTHADFGTQMEETATCNDIYYLQTELNNAYGTIRTLKDDITSSNFCHLQNRVYRPNPETLSSTILASPILTF